MTRSDSPRPVHDATRDTLHAGQEGWPAFLSTLRQETSPAHLRLEQGLALLDPGLTRARYAAILAGFYGFYRPLEARLEAHLEPRHEALQELSDQGLELASPRRHPLLRTDLLALGMPADEIDRLPECRDLPELEASLPALGCRYVLQGATLGGQVISRHIARHLGIDSSSGGAFFHGHGAETGDRWRAFLSLLQRGADSPAHDAAIIAEARQTFLCLERWLTLQGVIP